jgi:hypothetical protein
MDALGGPIRVFQSPWRVQTYYYRLEPLFRVRSLRLLHHARRSILDGLGPQSRLDERPLRRNQGPIASEARISSVNGYGPFPNLGPFLYPLKGVSGP